jgi:hypothetical protein
MAQDDIVGIRIIGRYQDQNVVNTMHYVMTEQVEDDHNILQSLAEEWENDHATIWLAIHNVDYELVGLRAFSVTGGNKRPGIVHIGDPGVVTGFGEPACICRAVTLYTDSDNFRRRGRLMLSATTSSTLDTTDGSVNATEVDLLSVFGAAMILPLTFTSNIATPGLAPTDVLPFEPFTAALGRKTPPLIRSRRIKGMLIG